MNAGRLHFNGRCFFSAPVCSSLVLYADVSLHLFLRSKRDEVLSIVSVFAYVGQLPDGSDSRYFCYVFQLPVSAFKIGQVDEALLTTVEGWFTLRLHSEGRGAMVGRCTSAHTDHQFVRVCDDINYERC